MSDEIDALLISLAQRSGGIEPLLHSLFSFLKRKTDFYHIQAPGDRIGFPPGKAKALVLEAFNRFAGNDHDPPSKNDLERKGERIVPKEREQLQQRASTTAAPKNDDQSRGPAPAAPPKEDASQSATAGASPQRGQASGGAASQESAAAAAPQVEGETKREEGAAMAKQGDSFVAYNGGEGKGYRWSQTIDEVVVFVDCSPHTAKVKGKDVLCEVQKQRIRIALRMAGTSDPKELLAGELFGEVLQDDVVWHVEDSRFVSITMEKRKKVWWKSALQGDAEIDTQKVDSTCSIEDYDQPTQAAIEKLMFDQQQKMQGKPTSDELLQHDMLRKAWDAEGSPFKGTPFDPSAINFSGSQGPMDSIQ